MPLWILVLSVAAGVLSVPEIVMAAPGDPTPGAGGQSVPGSQLKAQPETPSLMDDPKYHPARRATLPAGGAAVIGVDGGSWAAARAVAPGTSSAAVAGGLPVRVSAAADAPGESGEPRTAAEQQRALAGVTPPASVRVEVAAPAVAERAGVRGVIFTASRADGKVGKGVVGLNVDYTAFADLYGGNFGQRLTLVSMPACVLTTPQVRECQVQTRVPGAVNVEASGVVSAPVVDVAETAPSLAQPKARPDGSPSAVDPSVEAKAVSGETVFALAATSSSSAGSYTSTSLAPSYSWAAGSASGGFSWSYPMSVPKPLAGPSPTVELNYSSQSVDGLSESTNNQASWVGRGWDWNPGYIERTFKSCRDDYYVGAGDLCWSDSDKIAQLVLNGKSVTIVRSQWDGQYRVVDSEGWSVERVFGGWIAATTTPKYWWKVTTPDGMQYFFGRWQRYEPADTINTNSAAFVPVFGDDPGEECYAHWNGQYKDSWCNQAYRWNLDYVVDPSGNSMMYHYSKYTGKYGRNVNQVAADYDLTTTLDHIDYGMRAGQEMSAPAPYRVQNSWFNRIDASSTWRDVPWDQYCSATSCPQLLSPTFFTPFRLNAVTTQAWNAAAGQYRNVDKWDLSYEFPDAGGGSGPTLYLRSITHTGYAADGVTGMSEPAMRFEARPLQNRVDSTSSNGVPAMYHWRMWIIKTGTGREVEVEYLGTDCTKALLDAGQIDPDNNFRRCYPQMTTVGTSTGWGWFHKYVVRKVTDRDLVGGSPPETTEYEYSTEASSTNVLWAHDKADMAPIAKRTWSNWVGYSTVRTYHGDPSVPRSKTVQHVYRGLNGDRTDAGDYTRNVTAISSTGTSVDREPLAGRVLEELQYNSATIAESKTVTGYHALEIGVYDAPWPDGDRQMNVVTQDVSSAYTLRADGTWRVTSTDTDSDYYGLPSQVKNFGDTADPNDDSCTNTAYARGGSTYMMSFPSQITTRAGSTCAAGDARLAEVRYFYDSSTTLGAAPVRGLATKTENLVSSGPDVWATTESGFDALGRITSTKDARGKTTSTVYTPNTNAPLLRVQVTNPLSHTTSKNFDGHRGLITHETDVNNKVTNLAYDPLGRLTNVWRPGRSTSSLPNVGYAYTVRNDGPNTVTTTTLSPTGTQIARVELFDGRFRTRQTQAPAPPAYGGRIVNDTAYDSRGLTVKQSTFHATGAATGTLVAFNDVDVARQSRTVYDILSRPTAQQVWSLNTMKSQTTLAYAGERTTTVPPVGGATRTDIDAQGRTVNLYVYANAQSTGTPQSTTYAYDRAGNLITITDPAGNITRYGYDLQGHRTSTTDPNTGTSTTTYNAAGDTVSTTDARGQKNSFEYDALGRVTNKWAGEVTSGTRLASFTYDTIAKGQQTSSTRYDNGGQYVTAVTGFNDNYQPTEQTWTVPIGEGALSGTYRLSYTYNANTGATATISVPAAGGLPAETLTYGYDGLGNANSLTGSQTYVASTSYTRLGEISGRAYGSGTGLGRMTRDYTYDPATGNLATVVSKVPSPTAPTTWQTVQSDSYTYNATNDVTAITDTTDNQSQCFGYDAQHRLTDAWTAVDACATGPTTTKIATSGKQPYWDSWAFDTAGRRSTDTRRLSATVSTSRTYTYPAAGTARPHAATKVTRTGTNPGDDAFTYDAAGNSDLRTVNGVTTDFTFNSENQFSRAVVQKSTGNEETRHLYDANGNLLIRREPGATTLYAAGQEFKLAGGTVSCTRTYNHGKTAVAVRTPAGLTWLANDHQGSASIAVNAATGQVTKRLYTPYGADRSGATAWPTSRGFLGKQDNKSTKLVDVGAREYDPELGVFISPDPIINLSDPRTFNPYAYASHTPITQFDPSGLAACYAREEGDFCPGHTKGPASVNEQDSFIKKGGYFSTYVKPADDEDYPKCSNKRGSSNPCSRWLTDEERDLEKRVKKMTEDAEKLCGTSVNCVAMSAVAMQDAGPEEQAWCVTYFYWCQVAGQAKKRAERENPFDEESQKAEWNAFKHAYWFALVAQAGVSEDAALLLGAAHEIGTWKASNRGDDQIPDWGSQESRKDMHNNRVGWQIGQRTTGYSRDFYLRDQSEPRRLAAANIVQAINAGKQRDASSWGDNQTPYLRFK
ncbi:RHS repeat-associated core domain-containing protein [Virgisporangium aliadipatigenens]|nr:RHS repeat-associated core domain-containing protein [Virgisporangium aliadipatigenens]